MITVAVVIILIILPIKSRIRLLTPVIGPIFWIRTANEKGANCANPNYEHFIDHTDEVSKFILEGP